MAYDEQDKDFKELDDQLSKIEQELSAPEATRKLAEGGLDEVCRWYCIVRPYILKVIENPNIPATIRRLLRLLVKLFDLLCKCDQKKPG